MPAGAKLFRFLGVKRIQIRLSIDYDGNIIFLNESANPGWPLFSLMKKSGLIKIINKA